MNFSGNRYTREQLRGFLDKSGVETFVLDCEDSFGSYGTIGFGLVECSEVCMTDLMFSCRIQAKRVEHSFVAYLLRKYRRATSGDFFVNYRKTAKNAAPGKVFDDLGFLPLSESDGVTRLVFPRSSEVLEDGIVTIIDASVDVGAGSAVPTAVGCEPHSA
jgi:predicted enzyme involved in methoxymalonyl-ACP biosynthesis